MQTVRLSTLSAAMLVTLAGCTVGPDYKGPPKTAAPKTFASLEGADVQKAAPAMKPVATETAPDLAKWWNAFGDPVLDSLIERAVAGNHDLKIAAARVREARAQRGIEASAAYPTVNADGSVSRSRVSENTGNGFPAPTDPRNLFQAGLDASWEIDVFGGVRRAVEAADADLASTEEAGRETLVTLVAEVARNYADLRGFQQRVELNGRIVQAQGETLELTKSLNRAGISSELQVEQASAQLASREALLPPLRVGERAAAYRLAVLLGQEPGALISELAAQKTIPVPPKEIPLGLPSDLLRRRPDIRRAERGIASASARVGVATSDLFPKFSITGSFGLQSGEAESFVDMNSRYWSIGPAVRWNVFDAKRVRNRINAADAREEAAVATYERTVLTAMEDVENGLTQFIQEQARHRSLQSASDASGRALQLATDRYKSGIGDFLNVLETQRALYDLQDQLVQSELGVSRSLIAVYKALGGGWDAPAAAPAQGPKDANAAGR
jgi:NodT family efflux transporter outer membrane factor (OMF) lipoprotein